MFTAEHCFLISQPILSTRIGLSQIYRIAVYVVRYGNIWLFQKNVKIQTPQHEWNTEVFNRQQLERLKKEIILELFWHS